MFRHAIAVLCLVAIHAPVLNAQDEYDEPPSKLTFGQKFDRFRRNLLGEEPDVLETPPQRQPGASSTRTAHVPRSAADKANPPAMVARSSRRATEAERPHMDGARSNRETRQYVETDEAETGAEDITEEDVAVPAPETAPSRRAVDDSRDPAPVYNLGRSSPPAERAESSRAKVQTARVERRDPTPESSLGVSHRRVAPSATARGDNNNLLFSRKSPQLTVETAGPRRVVVGKAAAYRVFVHNSGDVDANDVVVTVGLPDWAEVTQAKASSGSTETPAGNSEFHKWTLPLVPAHGEEELSLQIVPRENKAFDLAVRWSCSPAGSQTTVEVQEPKLALEINGPKQVDCGAKQIYRLTVSNPGSGDAENVVLHLLPIEPGEGDTTHHEIGTISAGDDKVVEIELAARQGGMLTIQAEATAGSDLKAAAVAEVRVRKAELKLQVSAARRQFAGVAGTFEIRVGNPGNAAARQVQVAVKLPADAEFVSANKGGKADSKQHEVVWHLDALPAGEEESLSLKCSIRSPGEHRVDVTATAEDGLKEVASSVTEVVALADLTLEVTDPAGPLPVGEEMVYEVRIRNRGSKNAEGVEVTAFFSNGIEPVAVEGGPHEISPGTVVLETIPSLAPGKDVLYRIKAQAEQAGTHRFRVELVCQAVATKLTQEESTVFYADQDASAAATELEEEVAAEGKSIRVDAPRTSPNSPKSDNLRFVVPAR